MNIKEKSSGKANAPALQTSDKAGGKPVILGHGDLRFEWIDNWAKLPAGMSFGDTHSVQEANDGRIFIHHNGHNSTAVFDPKDGRFIEAWGGDTFRGTAHGMDLRSENGHEFLYLAPTGKNKTFKTTLKGDIVMELGYPAQARNRAGQPCYPDAKPYSPTYTAFGPAGDFYITDGYGLGYICRYDIHGKLLATFGGNGDGPDQESCPHGIFCDTRTPDHPMIVVADRAHHRLQYFTLDGKLDHLVTNASPQQDNDGTGKFRLPCQFSPYRDFLAIPDLLGRVTILDKNNNVAVHLGDNPNVKQRANHDVPQSELVPGHFCCPHGSTWDRHGNLYIVEWLPYGRVTKLRRV